MSCIVNTDSRILSSDESPAIELQIAVFADELSRFRVRDLIRERVSRDISPRVRGSPRNERVHDRRCGHYMGP